MVHGAAAAVSHTKAWEELVPTKGLRYEAGSMLQQNNSVSADAWISQASQRDMQSLTMALQRELCSQSTKSNGIYDFQSLAPAGGSAWTGSEWRCKSESEVSSESGAKGEGEEGGGLGIESLVSPQFKRSNGLSATGKVSKRRSRAANKTPITFLNADPANFRAMVQQVTGVPINPNATRLWSPSTAGVGMPGLVRPEPKRASSSAAAVTATASAAIQGLPTLDTSAIFIAACGGAPANLNNAYSSPPPPLARSAAPAEDFTEKLRVACMQSLIKNGGGSGAGAGAGSGYFVPDQNQGFMNFMQEADLWFNNNVDVELGGGVL
ncbi:hypothetical protein SUGI_1079680 [Cryptomeria japonica]|uniref:calmodulin-binding protein 25 n=1 Tax=Cryptomeria japonica TaxID=3369 RepID=UPI0024149E1F|nr:calmodulin-binding protein 25 [Cryptomeria japonica]GLJ50680.1 hypothetical protein SUGI_1079680 [Cryptomeria japonica]